MSMPTYEQMNEYKLAVNKILQGEDLTKSKYDSYNQLLIVEKNRNLTKNELNRKDELERFLNAKGYIKTQQPNKVH